MKKIILLSLALVAGLFVVSNVVKAADPTPKLDLEILGVPWYCQYGADLDLLTHAQSYSAFEMSGAFLNTSGTAAWFCNDTYGMGVWTMDISSDTLTTSLGETYTISNTFIEVKTSASKVFDWEWDPAVFTGTNWDLNARGANIASAKTLFEKTSLAGTVGKLWVDNVTLRVLVPANQEIGKYRSTITIQVPPMS